MAVRFRIRTSAGQELSFASHETFEVFVRDGDLSPDDLIYDGETGSWSPARTHPIVLDIEYERSDGDELDAGPEDAEDPGAAEVDTSGEGPQAGDASSLGTVAEDVDPAAPPSEDLALVGEDLALSLAPAEVEDATRDDGEEGEERSWERGAVGVGTEAAGEPGEPTADESRASGLASDEALAGLELTAADPQPPDDETRAFVERMEAEREADFGRGVPSVRRSGPAGVVLGDAAPLGDLPAAPLGETADPGAPRRPARRDGRSTWERAESAPPWRATVDDRTVEPAGTSTAATRGARVLGLLTVILLLGGTGGYAGFRLVNAEQPSPPAAPPSEPVRPMEVAAAPPATEPDPVIASTPSALRERAQERFLTATRTALRELEEIPPAWPTGDYLVLPSEHPEVVDVWQSYLDTIDRVRTGDVLRYRAAFVAALDDAGVDDVAREERLAAGMREFMGQAPRREAHYRRVTELANAAIRAHNELIAAEGLILFDGTAPDVDSGDIGAGLSGRNAESQRLLEEVVEVLEQRLSSDGAGPGAAPNVRAWVWDGLLAAMTAG